MHAMALLAKNDIHLRFENRIFEVLYLTYKNAIIQYQNNGKEENFAELGFQQIKEFLKVRENYDDIISLGEYLVTEKKYKRQITLTEVLSIRQYLNVFLMTLAVRNKYNDNELVLTPNVEPDETTE